MALYGEKCLVALTISPRLRLGDTCIQFNQDRFVIRKLLNRCTDHYMMWPELDRTYRLHYHGVVLIKDKYKWFKSCKKSLEMNLGYIKLSVITSFEDHLKWLLYSKKDQHWMKDLDMLPIKPRKLKRKPKKKVIW